MQKKYFKKNEIKKNETINNEINEVKKIDLFYKWREVFDKVLNK
jgi:hypothetical protein